MKRSCAAPMDAITKPREQISTSNELDNINRILGRGHENLYRNKGKEIIQSKRSICFM